MGYQYPIEGADHGRLTDTLYAMAAGNAEATERAVLLFNVGGETEIAVPEGEWSVSLLDGEHDLTVVGSVLRGERLTIPAEGAVLLESTR